MKYPDMCKTVVDVTKAPYFADPTGKTDCTKALQLAIDDCLRDYILGIEEVRKELIDLHEKYGGNVYAGAEAGKYIDGEIFVTLPTKIPPYRSLYFPAGTYLVSDTITYSFDNLFTQQSRDYTCELCRFIQISGQSRENTTIRLADHSNGFEKGKQKPVLSFNRASKADIETTNCAQMNTLEDITVDCGVGNEGAVGVLYASSNCGRIENVTVTAHGSFCGIDFDYGSEACIQNVAVTGFEFGMRTGHTSPLVMDTIDLSGNTGAGIRTKNGNIVLRNITIGEIPLFSFPGGQNGRYSCCGFTPQYVGDPTGSYLVTVPDNELFQNKKAPGNPKFEHLDDWVCVDDFGAVGDGQTDSTHAIQQAMNSGKSTVVFGSGSYRIERTVKIPATVTAIDFRYAELFPGYSLLVGEMEGMFDICEESTAPFFAEHIIAHPGFYRIFRHSAKRTAVFRDVSASASLYFNTVGGSEVYFDNCFSHTEHYSQDVGLHRDGYVPVFCRMIPVEVHGQKVYCRNLNLERADIELLNDGSEVFVDGYKVEGPGTLVKSINNGKTTLNLFNAAWWGNKIPEHSLFESHDSQMRLIGGNPFCCPEDETYTLALRVFTAGEEKRCYLKECSQPLEGLDALGRSWGHLITDVTID